MLKGGERFKIRRGGDGIWVGGGGLFLCVSALTSIREHFLPLKWYEEASGLVEVVGKEVGWMLAGIYIYGFAKVIVGKWTSSS